jgi:hypothetical protein
MFRFNKTIIREPMVCTSLKLQYWRQLKYFAIKLVGRVAAYYSVCKVRKKKRKQSHQVHLISCSTFQHSHGMGLKFLWTCLPKKFHVSVQLDGDKTNCGIWVWNMGP